MRKSFYLLLIALSLSTSAAAWDIIPLAVEIIEGIGWQSQNNFFTCNNDI